MAEGIMGQNIIIIPSKNLIIVRVAAQLEVRLDLARLVRMVISAEESLED